MFAGFNINAVGRTSGCTEHTRSAFDAAIIFEGQAMLAAVVFAGARLDLGIVNRGKTLGAP